MRHYRVAKDFCYVYRSDDGRAYHARIEGSASGRFCFTYFVFTATVGIGAVAPLMLARFFRVSPAIHLISVISPKGIDV